MFINFELKTALERLRAGQVVAIPTETVYGLAVDMQQTNAIRQLYTLKKMSADKPCSIAIEKPNDIYQWTPVTSEIRKLIQHFWPGPLTLIVPSSNPLIKTSLVGLRCSSHPFVQALLHELGHPVFLTSANLSGQKELNTAMEIQRVFGEELHIVAYPDSISNIASTILDLSQHPYKIIREGMISEKELKKIISF